MGRPENTMLSGVLMCESLLTYARAPLVCMAKNCIAHRSINQLLAIADNELTALKIYRTHAQCTLPLTQSTYNNASCVHKCISENWANARMSKSSMTRLCTVPHHTSFVSVVDR